MTSQTLCAIDESSDVEVSSGSNMSRGYSIKVKGMSKWGENFYDPKDALNALIAVREAGLKVPPHITKSVAERIVKRVFDTGDRL